MALMCAIAACGPAHTLSLTKAAASYGPTRIADRVPSRPGALAWSPDGKQLAFLTRTVTIIDVDDEAAAARRIDINAPRFLAWADDGTLSVLSREGDQDVLFLIDAGRPGIVRKALDRRADAVYPVDPRRSLLLSLETSRLKIGTQVRCTLSLLDLADGTASTLHTSSRIVPTADWEEDLLTAWVHAGPNPLDGSFLIMEHIKPPAFPPYTRVSAFDPVSGDMVEIGKQDRRSVYASAAWSPDGRKIALTDRDGRLEVRDLHGGGLLDIPAVGLYPAWHPAGDLLVVGGTLVKAATGERTTLVENGIRSFSRWSPDGTRLALVEDGELMLFRKFERASLPDASLDRDRKGKLAMLQELLKENLITREEYRERRSRLLSDKEGGPR
jgi:WD40 repeat protein